MKIASKLISMLVGMFLACMITYFVGQYFLAGLALDRIDSDAIGSEHIMLAFVFLSFWHSFYCMLMHVVNSIIEMLQICQRDDDIDDLLDE